MSQRSFQIANEQYVAEFPFLRNWLDGKFGGEHFQNHVKIQIERLDLDVLSCCSCRLRDFWGTVIRYFCIGFASQVLCEVPMSRRDYSGRHWWNPLTWFGKWVEGRSVEGAIMDLYDRISELAYVVCVVDEPARPEITVYKLPNKFSLPVFIQSERSRIQFGIRKRITDKSA